MTEYRTLTIDCQECTERCTVACDDCVVNFVLERSEPVGAVVLDLSQARAVRLLADAGLVAPLRHRRAAAGG